jgi:hypothetical protein
MEEVELRIEGYFDRLRYDRRNTYMIMSSFAKQHGTPEQLMPLPYDEQQTSQDTGMDELEKIYWSSTVPYN